MLREQGVALNEIVAQGALGVIAERHDAFLAALTAHLHLLCDEIEISEIDTAQFGESESARVEKFEHREVADVGELETLGAGGGVFEQRVGLPLVEIGGECARQPR